MIVDNYMTNNVITIGKETKIFDAVEVMAEHKIHRLPVVEKGRLIGLITEGTIQEALPSKATSLSVYEANYILNKTTAEDIMIHEVQTITKDSLLEEAIHLMRQNDVAVLPVVTENDTVIGIITNNDIFDAFLEITGYNQDGIRVSIAIAEDHQGVLGKLAQLFADNQIGIVQIVVYRQDDQPIIVAQLEGSDAETIQMLLKEQGYNVLSIIKTAEL